MQAGPVPWVLRPCLFAGLAGATQPDRCRGRRLGPWGEASGSLGFLLPGFPLQLPRLSHVLLLPASAWVCPPRAGLREPLRCQVPIPREALQLDHRLPLHFGAPWLPSTRAFARAVPSTQPALSSSAPSLALLIPCQLGGHFLNPCPDSSRACSQPFIQLLSTRPALKASLGAGAAAGVDRLSPYPQAGGVPVVNKRSQG